MIAICYRLPLLGRHFLAGRCGRSSLTAELAVPPITGLLITGFRYRPEIDGLRALAVLSVVLFHARLGFPGGFVGVDVFFVISGFLITSLTWKDLESNTFSLASFWERRARRIAPALVAMTLATLIAGWFILLPDDYRSLGKAARAQALFVANHHYCSHTDYFANAADEMPLLHTWSLAVEEQFYLLMPSALALLFRFRALRQRSVVIAMLAAGIVVSLGWSIYGVSNPPHATLNPSNTFFLLPGRAWELLLGSLVAFAPAAPRLLAQRTMRETISLAGLAMILFPLFAYDSSTPFPGLAALPPCLGAALFIWINGGAAESAATYSSRLFAWRPLVFIGLISYSLYLWHWPLLAFGKYLSLGEVALLPRLLLVGLGFVLAALSWKFVELPFRDRVWGATRRSMYAFAGSGMAAILIAGLICRHFDGFPSRVAPEQRRFVDARHDVAFQREISTQQVLRGELVSLGATSSTETPALLVWGDSHAMAALPAIDAFLKERNRTGVAATHSATVPLLNWYKENRRGLGKESIAFNQAVFEHIQARKIADVLLIARWDYYFPAGIATDEAATAQQALLAMIERLVAAGARPALMLEVPEHGFDIPRVLARPVAADANLEALCGRPADHAFWNPAFRAQLAAAGCRIIDPKPAFLAPAGNRYVYERDGVVLYRDHNHLTATGAKHLLLPLFREQLAALPGRNTQRR